MAVHRNARPPTLDLVAVAEEQRFQKKLGWTRRLLAIAKAREDIIDFTHFTMPDPEDPENVLKSRYHATDMHRAVGAALMQVIGGQIPMLIFCMPPRHGKTELATKRMAAFFIGKFPELDLAVTSYSDPMAEDFGADTRAIINTPQYQAVFPKVRLRKGGTAKNNIQTTAGGRAVFVGRGGALTGRGAHILLVDDLFKDYEEARSQTVRDTAWNWFTKVAMTRRMGKKLVILTMTRWHSDDIIGRLTDPDNPHYNRKTALKWKIIRLPAIAERDDPLGRAPGTPLWPEQFDLEFLQEQQRMDPLGFASLYQQSPTLADGDMFKRDTIQRFHWHELPEDLRYYCSSDHAVATGQRRDYTVLLKVGVDRQDNIYIVECDWRRMPSDVAVEAMLTMGASGNMQPLFWWAERGHISKSIGPFLRKRMEETSSWINIREVVPAANKEQRAQSIAARCAMGKLYIPWDAPWAENAINQMLAFPNGTFDDFVDALSQIGLGLQTLFAAAPPKVKHEEPKFGTMAWVKMMDKWNASRDRARNTGVF